MKIFTLLLALTMLTTYNFAQDASLAMDGDILAMNSTSGPSDGYPTKIETPRRKMITETEVADADKEYLTAGFFPAKPQVGKTFWLEYGLSTDTEVAIELFDQQGFSYLLAFGDRQAGVKVEALKLPAHLTKGTYYLKIRAGNGRSVIPISVR